MSFTNTSTLPLNSRSPKLTYGQRGFTIVEVMVAMFIIALGLTSATICLRLGMMQKDTASATSYATQVLQDEAERVRLLNWTGIQSLPATTTLTPSEVLSPDSIRPERFTFVRTVSDIADEADIKEIRLTASWSGLKQDGHNFSIVFRYAKHGMHDYYYGTR